MTENSVTAAAIRSEMEKAGDPKKAAHHQRFFKTGPGEYGEGDIFLGIVVPKVRATAKSNYKKISLSELEKLLSSPAHEIRQAALFMLVEKYDQASRLEKTNVKSDEKTKKEAAREKKEIVSLYLDNLEFVNNWDLVDGSAPQILGDWFLTTDPKNLGKETLSKLSKSDNLWEKRIAVMTTQAYIRAGIFQPTLKLCDLYLDSPEGLIHKATGWMLREIGKKDESVLIHYLENNASVMPRTMLRYSIEKLSPEQKEKYMNAAKTKGRGVEKNGKK
ncbi:DNA alkylation repair protein [Methanolapillus millepedarum]|uniref:DNA alkylation repair protein n=1 Tax=Methanolapillus millepedarum TaxID=3028296 RepID=A0AA96V3W5_9EURY|nr:hypothetical protein MsAc7_05560 [Methanosarcinaceae archaeon Ac7]